MENKIEDIRAVGKGVARLGEKANPECDVSTNLRLNCSLHELH